MSSRPTLEAIDRETALRLFRRMTEIRHFEDAVLSLFARNLVRGSTHLYQGQEAVAVGACDVLRDGDTMTCTYRGHGAVLAMGASIYRSVAEILGKADGLCRGKGGSMHLTDVERGALGSFAIVGAHLPIALGAAFTNQYREDGGISLTFFGDGATNSGAFHEALNMASVWKLPVIFVCENNLYGEYSPLAATTPIERLALRADSYAMAAEVVDGNDVFAVRDAVAGAAERARSGEGPTFIEALTYRQQGHSRTDPAKYRPEGELDHWLERDPLTLLRARAVEDGIATAADFDELVAAVEAEVAGAVARAIDAPFAAPEAIYEDIYA
jgi:pyruvate dehydrogenase E1 component alpha subunit